MESVLGKEYKPNSIPRFIKNFFDTWYLSIYASRMQSVTDAREKDPRFHGSFRCSSVPDSFSCYRIQGGSRGRSSAVLAEISSRKKKHAKFEVPARNR